MKKQPKFEIPAAFTFIKSDKKIKKISHTMIRRLAIVTVIVNFIVIYVMGSMTSSTIEEKEISYLNEILNNIASTISTNLAGYRGISEVVAMNEDIVTLLEGTALSGSMQTQENHDSVVNFLSSVESQFPAVINVGVCSIVQDAYLLHNGSISGSNWSFASRPYFAVTQTNTSMMTDPYVDDATGDLIVTMASPVLGSNGAVLGCIFVDLSIEFVVDLVDSAGFGETGKSLVVDRSGNLVACMSFEWIGTSYKNLGDSGAELENEMANPTGNTFEMIAAGEDAYAKAAAIEGTDWVIITNVSVAEFNEAYNAIESALLILLILSVSVTLIVAAVTVQLSVKPIDYLRVAMHELSQGNTHYQFDYESNNEIGALADDLRFTTKNLANYIDEIDRQLGHCGNGDFTVESNMEFLGDFASIQVSIRNFIDLISTALNGLKATVEQVSVGSDYVATGSQSLAEGSNRQSTSVTQLNEKIADITQSVTENVKNVNYVNDCSRKTAEDLKTNSVKMTEMVDSMKEINRTSDGIQKIVKTIEDVAFQTNILALNAAVEAARAGTAGRGFAVVADEVRNLSSRTSEAVQETARLIEDTVIAVKTGTTIVDATAEDLAQIIEFVESFMDSLTEITSTSQHQAEAIEEIHHNVNNISHVMEQNSSISEESASTSAELSSQAAVMKDTIERFKTRD
ncbi:MAG: methyl-accepting chemotaxis protein [Eubacteriales bacterium]